MKVIKKILKYLIVFLIILIFFSVIWSQVKYNNIKMEEIVFYLSVPLEGTESGLLISYFLFSLLPTIIVFLLLVYFIKEFSKKMKNSKLEIKVQFFKKQKRHILNYKQSKRLLNITILISSIVLFIISMVILDTFGYLKYQFTDSTFIEDNYVDSRKTKLIFPEKRKNIIYIYVESLETTWFSNKVGGDQKVELMPNIYELNNENINFSNTNKIGGARQVSGLTWTTGAMVGITSGLPLKVNGQITNNQRLSSMLEGDYTFGDILNKEGYNQEIMFGSDKNFGNRGIYFENHGNYYVYDLATAKQNKKIPKDYRVWWGFEDSKLFNYAKEEIIKLSKEDKPFNFSLLTANTHHVGGYLEENCEDIHNDHYKSSISCSEAQIYEFIKWIQQQDFYDNTTIVVSGDHLSMDPNFADSVSKDYERTVYNLFINSSVTTNNTHNRQFTTMDLFPTTLASMGVKIKGDRLALGTNLFSNKKTLLEKYGKEKLDNEMKTRSKFYEQNIIKKKK